MIVYVNSKQADLCISRDIIANHILKVYNFYKKWKTQIARRRNKNMYIAPKFVLHILFNQVSVSLRCNSAI